MAALESVKSLAKSRVGLWPILEVRNRAVRVPDTLGNRRFEDSEVARLRRRTLPHATVAVILPTYRRPESLVTAIASALGQTYTDLVVCVVDDGGGLPPLPEDPRLFSHSLSRNCGIAGLVRNVGIRLTDSTYVAFLDDDNTWEPEHLATLVGALEAAPELAGVYSSVRRLDRDGHQFDVLGRPFDRHLLRNEAFVDMNSLVVRRDDRLRFSVLRRSGARPPAEDWELVWRLSRRGTFAHIPVTTVNYTLNPESYFAIWYRDEPPLDQPPPDA